MAECKLLFRRVGGRWTVRRAAPDAPPLTPPPPPAGAKRDAADAMALDLAVPCELTRRILIAATNAGRNVRLCAPDGAVHDAAAAAADAPAADSSYQKRVAFGGAQHVQCASDAGASALPPSGWRAQMAAARKECHRHPFFTTLVLLRRAFGDGRRPRHARRRAARATRQWRKAYGGGPDH